MTKTTPNTECVCFCGYEATPDDPCPQCGGTVPFREGVDVDPVMVLALRIFEEWGALGLIEDQPIDPPDPEWEKAKVAARAALIDGSMPVETP